MSPCGADTTCLRPPILPSSYPHPPAIPYRAVSTYRCYRPPYDIPSLIRLCVPFFSLFIRSRAAPLRLQYRVLQWAGLIPQLTRRYAEPVRGLRIAHACRGTSRLHFVIAFLPHTRTFGCFALYDTCTLQTIHAYRAHGIIYLIITVAYMDSSTCRPLIYTGLLCLLLDLTSADFCGTCFTDACWRFLISNMPTVLNAYSAWIPTAQHMMKRA